MKDTNGNKPRLGPGITLVDTHCHLDMDAYAREIEQVVASAAGTGVTRIVTVGIDLASSRRAVELAKMFPGVWATIGIHPHSAGDAGQDVFKQFRSLAGDRTSKVIGYGEIGLDFAKNYAPRPVQIASFTSQIVLAKELELPIIIHDRDAHDETLDILQNNAPYPAGGVMHCFSGDPGLAGKIIDLGFYISIPGIVTFKSSEIMQQVAREIPLERMILETDGPFLAPVPHRGKTNHPAYLLYTAGKIAELRGISLDDVARQTTLNAESLFNLPREQESAC